MLEGISDRANKLYDAMKNAGLVDEGHMRTAEQITTLAKMPKNFVLDALGELSNKGYAKRKARDKAAGYWLIK